MTPENLENFTDQFIDKIQELQVLLLLNGGSELNLEIDRDVFDRLLIGFDSIYKYVAYGEDKPTADNFTLYGPMCKTTVRKKND